MLLIRKKRKKVMRRKLSLNNILRAIQKEPNEDKELFGNMILQMGIPNVKKAIRKVRKLSDSGLLNLTFL